MIVSSFFSMIIHKTDVWEPHNSEDKSTSLKLQRTLFNKWTFLNVTNKLKYLYIFVNQKRNYLHANTNHVGS